MTVTPTVRVVQIPQQKKAGEDNFPHVLETEMTSAEEAVLWAKNTKDELSQTLKRFGAILFRGFPITNPQELSEFIEALGVQPLPYVGGAAPRNTVYRDVHTTNESPPDSVIPFHHEMAQVPLYPQTLFFYCQLPPKEGGETPILRSDVIYNAIARQEPAFVEKLERQGVIYKRVIPKESDPTSPIGRGWTSTFGTTDPKEAEKAAANLNVKLEWLDNGDVKTVSPVLDAVKTVNGKKVWFNSVIAAYNGWQDSRNDRTKAVVFGDETPLDPKAVATSDRLMKELCVSIPWQQNDFIWVDNEQVMHSRAPFTPPRQILAYLGKNKVY